MRAAARRWGEKAALKSMREPPTSFAALDAGADRFAKALIADGMVADERVGIWSPNLWEWVAAAVGAQRAGGAIVPLNPLLRGPEVADIARRAGVKYLVAIGEHRGRNFPAMLRGEHIQDLIKVIVLRPDPTKLAGAEIPWEAFLALGESVTDASLREREAGVTPSTVSDILFTSGTTGAPKGAVFTHGRSVRSGHGMKNFASVTDADCLCPLGPFAHFAGYKGGWVNGLVTGATVCWSDAHDAESMLTAIATMGITVMPAPPIIWQDILDHPNRADWNTSSLRFAATGSTTIPPQLVRRLVSELKVRQVATGYGLTESGGMTNFTRPTDPVEKVAYTAGRSAPDAEVCIAGLDGERLGPNQPGEVLVRTERATAGYLNDPDATAAAIDAERWLHTGDVGCIDDDGYLKITDRLKDMYITNGYNVYPAELEKLISGIPGVQQCAVIGVAEPRKGEVGHAFLVRAAGSSLTEVEIMAWCKDNIASYKIPKHVSFVDALPRNSLGKILKRELRTLV
jgi:acyl-CoA synthetase (AMP-forming)/AMP-acid ligase II